MVARSRTVAYVTLVFASGLLLGASLVLLAEHIGLRRAVPVEYDLSQHRLVAMEMKTRLHLSDDQQLQVDQILQDTLAHYQALQQRLQPQYDAVRAADRERLRAILTPGQRSAFDAMAQQADLKYPVNVRPEVLAPSTPCAGAAPSPH